MNIKCIFFESSHESTLVTYICTQAHMALSNSGTDASIQTRAGSAEVHPEFAVTPTVARLAVAAIVVHQLHAVLSSSDRAGVGQALVHIPFTPARFILSKF